MCFYSSHEAHKHLLLSLNALRVLRFVLYGVVMTSIDSSFCKHKLNLKNTHPIRLLGQRRNGALQLVNDKCTLKHFHSECRFNGAIIFLLVHGFIAMTHKLTHSHFSFFFSLSLLIHSCPYFIVSIYPWLHLKLALE